MLISFPAREISTSSALEIFHDIVRFQTTECLEFIDITEEVQTCVAASRIKDGMVNVQTQHTTGTIILNENEPLLLEDLKMTLEGLAPRGMSYQHDDFSVRTVNLTPHEKANGHAHCKALFLRSSEIINIANGKMQLGTWQRIFFIELDCARERSVSVMVMGLRD